MSGWWLEVFEDDAHFGPPASASFAHEQRLPSDDFIASLASRSYIATLGEAKRAEIFAEVAALLERDDAPVEGA